MRRPSASTAVALTALFVALGGPAQAARLVDGRDIRPGTVTSTQVKDHSLRTRDLTRAAVRTLRTTRNNSISERKLAPGAVSTGKLAAAAVTTAKLGAGAVGTVAVADGSLSTADVARFSGRFSVRVSAIAPFSCWVGAPQGLGPEKVRADISQDLVLVTPDYAPDRKTLAVTPWVADRSHFAINVCNVSAIPYAGGLIGFRYAVLRVP